MAPADDAPEAAVKLDDLQRDILLAQIQAFIEATSDPAAREPYLALKDAVEKSEVPADQQARLGAIVEVALSSGRVRRLFGPGAELSLNALFQKTPRGRDIGNSIRELNAALAKLKGQAIEEVSAALKSPGIYSLTLKTGECQIVIRFEPAGVRIESLDVDLS
ncbi:MAG TPA: hypothetical protein VIX59_07425 [Candidatus Binataceae bacterium]